LGWQTAPGGTGWKSRPERVWFREAQAEGEGQDCESGVDLQVEWGLCWVWLAFVRERSWTRKTTTVKGT
jgi:hypothetical protein